MTWIDTALDEARKVALQDGGKAAHWVVGYEDVFAAEFENDNDSSQEICRCEASPYIGVEKHIANMSPANTIPLLEAVKKVCESEPILFREQGTPMWNNCGFCLNATNVKENHAPNCPWILLRKAAGYEALEGEA